MDRKEQGWGGGQTRISSPEEMGKKNVVVGVEGDEEKGWREGDGGREAGRVSLGVGVDVMGMCVSEREREDGGREGEGEPAGFLHFFSLVN